MVRHAVGVAEKDEIAGARLGRETGVGGGVVDEPVKQAVRKRRVLVIGPAHAGSRLICAPGREHPAPGGPGIVTEEMAALAVPPGAVYRSIFCCVADLGLCDQHRIDRLYARQLRERQGARIAVLNRILRFI